MAARRSPRSRSGGGRRPSRAAQTNNNVPVVIGAGVVIVVILVAVAMNMGGDPLPAQEPPQESKKAVEEPKSTPVPARAANDSSKVLTDPDTPAPPIRAGLLAEVDALYSKAKKLNDDARRAQSTGDDSEFNRLINDSWDTLLELEGQIERYTDWLEEADMGDWRVPADYRPLQQRIAQLDTLKGRVKRIKPNRR